MRKALAILAALALTGCGGIMFNGKRDIGCKLNILGNTIDWTSKVDGGYFAQDAPQPEAEEPAPPVE